MLFSRARTIPFQLRLLQADDASQLFYTIHTNRAYLRQWLPWVDGTLNVDDSLAFIEDTIAQYKQGECVVAAIWCENRIVGCIGLNNIQTFHQKAEIGYWLARNYQEKGIITRACRQMINYAFDELKLNRVEILVAEKNRRSRSVAERLGFEEEGLLRNYYRHRQEFVDVVIYGMLKKYWKSS
ncbi:GNAT family protein [Xanthocytophaga agilis]|uniref:GNAT family protein n=1 Tax=Xanthocytophaga agilis TaxID=3048010 RepID=A0AAE3R8G7_9BACT|nr:GNAT family protein [Xanthocytophaga agilis]MDJ1503329.1 GNAT family protein [Xanthocytophaga agilis]